MDCTLQKDDYKNQLAEVIANLGYTLKILGLAVQKSD